jgi:hypothetical protein
LVQLIPHIGGAIDTLFAGKGAKIQQDRLDSFLESLAQRIRIIESKSSLPWSGESEELYDFILMTLTDAIRIRSTKKREFLAILAASQVVHPRPWLQAEAAERMLASLEELHIEVLLEVSYAPQVSGVWREARVVTINNPDDPSAINPTYLPDRLPGYQSTMLRLACAELLGKGLLLDEGVGRLSARSMTYFVISDLGKWFLEWLHTEPRSSGDISAV